MALDYSRESLEGLDESIASNYIEQDGRFVLDVTGVKPEDEFSKVHTLLQKERNDRKTAQDRLKAFGERNPEDYYSLEDQIEQLKLTQGEIDEEKLNKLLETRTKPLTRQQERLQAERDKALSELDSLRGSIRTNNRDSSVIDAANGKIRPEFMTDLKLRAQHMLEYSEDMDSYLDENGLNVEEWVQKQIQLTPSWMPDSAGSGSRSSTTLKDSSDSNPFTEKGWSMTKQAQLYRDNKPLYDRLKAQANNPKAR